MKNERQPEMGLNLNLNEDNQYEIPETGISIELTEDGALNVTQPIQPNDIHNKVTMKTRDPFIYSTGEKSFSISNNESELKVEEIKNA